MAKILFENGKRIGEITKWVLTERAPVTKTVLGKEISTLKQKDQCEFVSPKPVKWKSALWIIEDDKFKLTLAELNVKGGVNVVATVADRQKI